MRVGSLCTGYGGLEMGLEAAFGDIDLRFVSDIDKDVSTLLAHHYPHISNLGDLTTVDWKQQDEIDVLTAGYPCQPFSLAGKREGSEDDRAIFSYISDAVSVLRPRYLFFENVAGHVTLGGVGVIAELTRLRYDCQWSIVSAAQAGSAHQRKRLFIWCETSNTAFSDGRKQKQQSMGKAVRSATEPRKPDSAFNWQQYETAIRRWETITGRLAPNPEIDNSVNPVFVEWLMGLPEGHVTSLGLSRSAELKMLGNGVVPQQARLALEILTEGGVYA
jgi:DNA (cytosine-5)-methyltransferase 1